jgi:hypothetical protein
MEEEEGEEGETGWRDEVPGYKSQHHTTRKVELRVSHDITTLRGILRV